MALDLKHSDVAWRLRALLQAPTPDYLYNRRSKHRRVVAGLGVITLISIVGYLLFPPLFAPQVQLPRLIVSAVFVAVSIGLYLLISRTEAFLQREFIDIVPAVLLFTAQLTVNISFFPYAAEFGSSEVSILALNAAVAVVALAIVVVGSFRSFLLILVLLCAIVIAAALHYAKNVWHLTQMAPFATMVAIAAYVNMAGEWISRISFDRKLEVEAQKTNVEHLLYNMLPEEVVARIKRGEIIADPFQEVSVIFCDIVGFTDLSGEVSPGQLIKILQDVFDVADECAQQFGIEQVKTVGDAYLAVAGGMIKAENCANSAIEFAIAFNARIEERYKHSKTPLQLRIGIHTGSVVGGVIGRTKKVYDYWGETVNIASRIQSSAEPAEILISGPTFLRTNLSVQFGAAVSRELKGLKKPVLTYAVSAPAV